MMRGTGDSRTHLLDDKSGWIAVAFCAGLIFFFSTMPRPSFLVPLFAVPQGDKIGHILAYGFLTVLCFRAFRDHSSPWVTRHVTLVTIFTVSCFGLFCEWFQAYLPYRSTDVWDLLSNGVGSCCALSLRRSIIETTTNVQDVPDKFLGLEE